MAQDDLPEDELESMDDDAVDFEEEKENLLLDYRVSIWGGMESREDVLRIAKEETLSYRNRYRLCWDEVRCIIEEEFGRKAEEEKSWPEVTDVDRLYAAFASIEEKGVIALHAPSNTMSSCGAVAHGVWSRRGGDASGFFGAVHYSDQDVDIALEGASTFHIAFQPLGAEETDAASSRVALTLVEALRDHGLDASWSGDVGRKVSLPLVWRKRDATSEPEATPAP
ncbi:DUF6891 domain-containing protein [Rhizobium leguminosarum]|uniref:DUF6891 domain-containing protein n=1 Tax=Rhizobium leguminosarum TaxID=384 RepID=UPI002E10E349|nr:hypothetical protein U8Q02_39440 [Rhizobium leguminosarum]